MSWSTLDWPVPMRGSRQFYQWGPTLASFVCFCLLVFRGRAIIGPPAKRAIIGPPAKRHFNGVSVACRWWPNISFVIRNLIFCDFRGCSGKPCPLSGFAHEAVSFQMGLVAREADLLYTKYKGAEQPAHTRRLVSAFVFRPLHSIPSQLDAYRFYLF